MFWFVWIYLLDGVAGVIESGENILGKGLGTISWEGSISSGHDEVVELNWLLPPVQNHRILLDLDHLSLDEMALLEQSIEWNQELGTNAGINDGTWGGNGEEGMILTVNEDHIHRLFQLSCGRGPSETGPDDHHHWGGGFGRGVGGGGLEEGVSRELLEDEEEEEGRLLIALDMVMVRGEWKKKKGGF